ncbi:MAG: PEP/pyruvate-binding domain-containing protein [Rhodomicrobium sp.]
MSTLSPENDLFIAGAGSEGAPLTAELAGSKAANLWQMARLGLKVPPAFVISTRLCKPMNAGDSRTEELLRRMLSKGIGELERATGRVFGGARLPLLVSVRSGAARSMPGMLDTVLNTGMTPRTVHGLIRVTGNPRLAWDSYRRFVQSYTEVAGAKGSDVFAAKLGAAIKAEGAASESELDPEALERLTATFLDEAAALLGEPIPSNPYQQLETAAKAVYRSWEGERAREYRRLYGLGGLAGTAVTVQAMVFGNGGGRSGAGVAFTRNPATGAKGLYIDFLFDAQGEDVVSGRRTMTHPETFKERLPEAAQALEEGAARLESHFRDMQDIEFTVEDGTLYFLQTRPAKRTPRAALRVLIDLVHEGAIDRDEGAKRAAQIDFEAAAVTRFEGEAAALATGTPASAGVASGRAVFESARAVELSGRTAGPIVLIRPDTSTADVAGFAVSAGILTASGGRTAHAAVVARQLGKACIAGCAGLAVDATSRQAAISGHTIKEGDWLSIDGESGEVFLGERRIVTVRPEAEIAEIESWRKRGR